MRHDPKREYPVATSHKPSKRVTPTNRDSKNNGGIIQSKHHKGGTANSPIQNDHATSKALVRPTYRYAVFSYRRHQLTCRDHCAPNNPQAQKERVRRLQIPRGPGKSRHGGQATMAQQENQDHGKQKNLQREDTRTSLRHPERQPTNQTQASNDTNDSRPRGTKKANGTNVVHAGPATGKHAGGRWLHASQPQHRGPLASPRPRVSSSPRKLTAGVGDKLERERLGRQREERTSDFAHACVALSSRFCRGAEDRMM